MNNVTPQRGLSAIKPYVPGKPIEEVKREYGLTDVIKLASNENPLGTSPKVVAALQAAVTEMNIYPDAQNYYLRQALPNDSASTPSRSPSATARMGSSARHASLPER